MAPENYAVGVGLEMWVPIPEAFGCSDLHRILLLFRAPHGAEHRLDAADAIALLELSKGVSAGRVDSLAE